MDVLGDISTINEQNSQIIETAQAAASPNFVASNFISDSSWLKNS
jgi:hypothetical protein